VDPNAHPSQVTIISYSPDLIEETEVAEVARLKEARMQGAVSWVNVDGLGTKETIEGVRDTFDLHPLAMEDVVNVGQRPKVEEFGGCFYVVLRMPRSLEARDTEQLSLFLGRAFVLTFQEKPGDCLEPVRKRIREGRARIRGSGSSYLAYAVIDAVMDAYFPVIEEYSARLLELEHRLLTESEPVPVSELYDLKRDLLTVRNWVRPLREELSILIRADSDLIAEQTRTYLRDCYDHSLQLIDQVESYRELASSLIELNRTNAANRLNEVMKVLTIIATVFIPMSFIAGVYGMNFDQERSRWNMTELGWVMGYPFALGLMLAMAVGMLVYFRKKGWL
jgi:magnesium transporter